jgi:hypothetical protein
MKALLINYLADKQRPKDKRTFMLDKSEAWRDQFINNLHELLGEVAFTSQPEQQAAILDKVYAWYNDKVHVKARSVSPIMQSKTPSAETNDRTYSRLSTNATPTKEPTHTNCKTETASLEAKAVESILPRLRPASVSGVGIASYPHYKPQPFAERKADDRFAKLKARQLRELQGDASANCKV